MGIWGACPCACINSSLSVWGVYSAQLCAAKCLSSSPPSFPFPVLKLLREQQLLWGTALAGTCSTCWKEGQYWVGMTHRSLKPAPLQAGFAASWGSQTRSLCKVPSQASGLFWAPGSAPSLLSHSGVRILDYSSSSPGWFLPKEVRPKSMFFGESVTVNQWLFNLCFFNSAAPHNSGFCWLTGQTCTGERRSER